ncbi:hypothetical protein TWF730_000082 [Orbilia blumenaviensis]|uniref:Uncharacterized protein n=1 Tax=Orbilia blumenaviensis TaxID=1796055 RepID=A0AAV9VKG9_9PEZI
MYQGYCQGKDTLAIPTVTKVNSEVVVQTTIEHTETVELTARRTNTVVETVRAVSVQTIFTGTTTTSSASVVTMVIYSTLTTILTDASLGELASQWKGSGGLHTGDKVAIAIGVVAAAVIICGLLWIVTLQTKTSMMKQELDFYRNNVQYGGINAAQPDK